MSDPVIQFVGPAHNVQIFGIKLLGVDVQNGRKLLFTVSGTYEIVGMPALDIRLSGETGNSPVTSSAL